MLKIVTTLHSIVMRSVKVSVITCWPKLGNSTVHVAGHEIVRIVVRGFLKAQPLIEPIRSLVLQSDRKYYLLALRVGSSNRIF